MGLGGTDHGVGEAREPRLMERKPVGLRARRMPERDVEKSALAI